MPRRPDPTVAHAWNDRLTRFQQQHQTVAEFCRLEGVSTASFYQWKKKLDLAQPKTKQHAPRKRQASFATVQIKYPGTTNVVAELPGGTRLVLPADDPTVLHNLLATIARHDARQARRRTRTQGAQAC